MNTILNVLDQNGKVTSNLTIPVCLSSLTANKTTIYRVTTSIFSNMNRVRSCHYKNVSGLEGSTRKIRQQKRTGKSRQGSIREIHMRGGAVKFGFTGIKALDAHRRYRSYKKINRKEARLALLQLIANRYQNNNLYVFDNLNSFDKTKDAFAQLNTLSISRPIIVYGETGLSKAYNNLKDKTISNVASLNAYKVLSKPELMFDKSSIEVLFKLESSVKTNPQ